MIFEGEYLNGKKNGKGKEYHLNGKISFEDEYLNDKEWIGTAYDRNGNILYTLNNNINGKGKEYFTSDNKVLFEGEYLNGKRNGKGKEYYYDGKLKFEGEYKNDIKWNGKGYDLSNNIAYELKNGKGIIKEYSGDGYLMFEGEYSNGQRNGKGKEYDDNILLFEGEYKNDKRNGKGRKYYNDGKLWYEGEYLYDFQIKGKSYLKEKLEFEGEYLYNKKWNGKGYDENGNVIYELMVMVKEKNMIKIVN